MNGQDLKNSILQMAMQGKLVEQRPEEGTGEELYKQIQEEKQKLIYEGKLKKEKPLPEILEEEILFDIPETWKWIRLGSVIKISTGSKDANYAKDNGNYSFYTCSKEPMKAPDYSFEGECIIAPGNGANVGLTFLVNEKFEAYQRTYVLEKICPYLDMGFLNYVMMWNWTKYNSDKMFGSATPYIKLGNLQNFYFPLPPQEEQKRITVSLGKALKLAEEYGKFEKERDTLDVELPEKLKKSILQYAMQGKLVPQIPSEGTAEELLKELKSKKQELIQEGIVLKKKETVPFYQPEDLAVYNIPNSWRWVKLSDVSIIQEGAGIRKWQYRNKGTQVLCVTNILDGRIDLVKKTLFIDTDEFKEKYLHLKINDGDIVTSCSGGSWGKVAVFESDKTLMLNTSTLRLRFFGDLAFNMYLYYVCTTPLFKQQLSEQLSGMQPNFGYAHYSRIMIPLPPVEEQKRICDKFALIMHEIETLRGALAC